MKKKQRNCGTGADRDHYGLSVLYGRFGFGPTGTGSAKNIKTGLDLAGGVQHYIQAKEENPDSEDMRDTVYKMQKRVEQYSTEAQAYQEGSNRITVEIPGVTDADQILNDLGNRDRCALSNRLTRTATRTSSMTERPMCFPEVWTRSVNPAL